MGPEAGVLGVMGIALRLGMRLGALTEGDSDALRRSRPTSMVNDCARLRTMAGCAAGASEATGISQNVRFEVRDQP